MRRLLAPVALFLILLFPTSVFAWSHKEHVLVTRLAVQRLQADPETPEAMKDWLRKAAPTAGDLKSARKLLTEEHLGARPEGLEKLDYWVVFPDIARSVDGDAPVWPYGTGEAPMHFFDLEYLNPDPADHHYAHDLSNKPDLEDISRDWRDRRLIRAGFLPYRVEQVYNDLVEAIREDHLMPEDENDRENALVLAGYLAHYLADNTQPQHATADYRSASYFAEQAPNVHGMFEYGMVDWEGHDFPELREELWEKMQAYLKEDTDMLRQVVYGGDPWKSTLVISDSSYDFLPLIGVAAQKAAGQAIRDGDPTQPVGAPERTGNDFDVQTFFRTKHSHDGAEGTLLDVKSHQLYLATVRIEVMLRQAWNDAHGVQRPKLLRTAPAQRPSTRSSD